MDLEFLKEISACLFDLDGVLTNTSAMHASIWKETLDLCTSELLGENPAFVPFQIEVDYEKFMNGRPRPDGICAYLAAKSIELPVGASGDPPGWTSLNGIVNEKQRRFRNRVRREGVEVFEGSIRFLEEVRSQGIPCAVVSSSTTARHVIRASDLEKYFDSIVDGNTIRFLGNLGKPDPAPFLIAASELQVEPKQAAVFEDSTFGIESGRRGGFLEVVGVNRRNIEKEMYECGATRVVSDLMDLIH